MAKKAKSKGGSIKLDGRKMQGGGSIRIPEGDYVAKIATVERATSQQDNPMIVIQFEILEPEKFAGKRIKDRITLTEKAMWRAGSLLDALEIKYPKTKEFTLPFEKILGKTLGITVADGEPYQGRVKSEVKDYLDEETARAASDEDLEDEDEEEEDEDTEEEEEDDDDDEDLEELDVDDEL